MKKPAADYINPLFEREVNLLDPLTEISPAMRNKQSGSPNRLKSSDSLSLSITQKDSNNKNLP
jgi:hypothetical protein